MNKEIENKLNAIASNDATELLPKEADKLLSYIEQLEKDKKELKDGWQQEIYDKNKVLNDWLEDERKINILENNRDKAIEYLNQPYRDNFDYSKAELINILESDE